MRYNHNFFMKYIIFIGYSLLLTKILPRPVYAIKNVSLYLNIFLNFCVVILLWTIAWEKISCWLLYTLYYNPLWLSKFGNWKWKTKNLRILKENYTFYYYFNTFINVIRTYRIFFDIGFWIKSIISACNIVM